MISRKGGEKEHELPGAYRLLTVEKVRYSDTDRQGHVNNVAFMGFLEAGRVAMLFEQGTELRPAGGEFVLARTTVDFLAELKWPGEITVASRIEHIGRSSMRIRQALFQNEHPAAVAESVMVMIDQESGQSMALPSVVIEILKAFHV